MLVLGQSAGRSAGSVFFWGLVLIGLIALAFVGVMYLKRWVQNPEDLKPDGGGFTLSDLRELHRQGRMTEEEYEAARIVIVDAAQRASDRQRALAAEKATAEGRPAPVDDVERIRARRAERDAPPPQT